ncbi:hypothetical protein ACQEVZ_60565 [Dactylosporangium sp. CA-152071]|uniref:hypothetical protein n=1 Tax=Dactylosporangium sp. CA-152071 TaxID=3239933 RepID=UPI003D8D78A0
MTAYEILDDLAHEEGISTKVEERSRVIGVTWQWLLGATIRLGGDVDSYLSQDAQQLRQALDELDDAGTFGSPLSLLQYVGEDAEASDAVDVHLAARRSRIDIDGLSSEVRRAYFASVVLESHDGLLPILVTRISTSYQLAGGAVSFVRAADQPAGSALRATPADVELLLDLYEVRPGPAGDVASPGAATRFSRALSIDQAVFGTARWHHVDNQEPTAAHDIARRLRSTVGFGRFLDDTGQLAPGFTGVIEHVTARPRTRGIVLYRTTAADGDLVDGVLNVFSGHINEVVFIDPLTSAVATLPADDVVEVLFLPTQGNIPARFAPVGGNRPDQLFSWPPRALTGLGLTDPEAGRFLVFAARIGQWIGTPELSIVSRYLEAWHSAGRPAAPHGAAFNGDAIGAMPELYAALLQEFGGVWRLPSGLTAQVVHAASGRASTSDPATNAVRLSLLELAGVPQTGAVDPPDPGDGADDDTLLTRAYTLALRLSGFPDLELPVDPEEGEPPHAALARQFPASGGFGRFLSPSGDRMSGFDGVIEHLVTTSGRGFVLFRMLSHPDGSLRPVRPGGVDGAEATERLLNVFVGRQGEIVFVDPARSEPATLPVGGPVDVLYLPTTGTVAPDRTERVDTTAGWEDILAELHIPPAILAAGVPPVRGSQRKHDGDAGSEPGSDAGRTSSEPGLLPGMLHPFLNTVIGASAGAPVPSDGGTFAAEWVSEACLSKALAPPVGAFLTYLHHHLMEFVRAFERGDWLTGALDAVRAARSVLPYTAQLHLRDHADQIRVQLQDTLADENSWIQGLADEGGRADLFKIPVSDGPDHIGNGTLRDWFDAALRARRRCGTRRRHRSWRRSTTNCPRPRRRRGILRGRWHSARMTSPRRWRCSPRCGSAHRCRGAPRSHGCWTPLVRRSWTTPPRLWTAPVRQPHGATEPRWWRSTPPASTPAGGSRPPMPRPGAPSPPPMRRSGSRSCAPMRRRARTPWPGGPTR